MRPVQLNLRCNINLLAPLCRQTLLLLLICLYLGMLRPNLRISPSAFFEHSGSSSSPSLVPIATPTPQIGSLGLFGEQISALVVFLPVKFGDLAVSSLLDSGATYDFLATSLLPKI